MYTFVGWMSEFPEESLQMIDRRIRSLGHERAPDDINTMIRIYPLPAGTRPGAILHPKEWLQTAGTADRLTVEVKRRDTDGFYRQYVLGQPLSWPEKSPSECIQFGDHEVYVRPNEVLAADDAVEIFQFYYEHGDIPSKWQLRNLPEYTTPPSGS